jgi:integrase
MLALRLARWGGLRAGEVLRVRVCDVDIAGRALTVRDTKRQRHGHGSRSVPIFPELQPIIDYAADRPQLRSVETRLGLLMPLLGSRTSSATTQRARRMCERVGVQPWERFWQNMRATRESELMDAFSLKDACKWIGNSPEVAMKHYALVRSTEFDRASGRDAA